MRLKPTEWVYTHMPVLWLVPAWTAVLYVAFTFGDWGSNPPDPDPHTHVSIAIIGFIGMIVMAFATIISFLYLSDFRQERRGNAIASRAIRYRRTAVVVIPSGDSVTVKLYDARAGGTPRQYLWPLRLKHGDREFHPQQTRTFFLDQEGQDEAAHAFVADFKARTRREDVASAEAQALARALSK